MPQLIALGLVGVLVWYAYRSLKTQMQSVDQEMRKRREKRDRPDVDELEKGEDGVYRLKQHDRDEG